MKIEDWLGKVKTVVDGLELIDSDLLPPSFGSELFDPVKDHKHYFEELGRLQSAQSLMGRLSEISRRAEDRSWYFWEKAGVELQEFTRAEHCTFFRLGSAGAMHKLHPLKAEEENEEHRWPASIDANPAQVTLDGAAQSVYLRWGMEREFPIVILLQSQKPFPRIAMSRCQTLTDLEGVLYVLVARHFPTPAGIETMEIVGLTPEEEKDRGMILGDDPAFKKALESVDQAAQSDATVYLTGESGTGKELFARHLHNLSARKDGPFIPINCSAIPHELIESEMFGHEKGAFTGAYYRKIGKAEQAAGGTLFLDEIGEMPHAFQAKLLRYLQEKKFTRVGGNNTVFSDARIVVATHRDLKVMVEAGSFREDLYYRVHVIPIRIPPLRERGRDIRALAEVFFSKYIGKSRASRRQVDETVFDVLERYPFPGNVRELDNIIQRTVVMTRKPVISAEDLPDEIFNPVEDEYERYRLHPFEKLDGILPKDREVLKELKREVEHIAFSYQRDLDRRFLLHLLAENGGSARKAAEAANINRTLFYKLLKRAGLDINIVNKSDQ
ncbi:MAG: sigma-54 dependent transcriptional regulator [Acidobacteriota bacterium]|nr:sigma-54 dependent transcriptional regulator [Acidobacteriota bacterium]